MQRMAEAMRERLGKDQSASGGGGGGGGASQRELARTGRGRGAAAGAALARAEVSELAEAAQDSSAPRMRCVAPREARRSRGSRRWSSSAARPRLEGARADRVSESVRQLERQAHGLQDRQREEITEGVKASGAGSPQQRAEQIRRMGEKKD